MDFMSFLLVRAGLMMKLRKLHRVVLVVLMKRRVGEMVCIYPIPSFSRHAHAHAPAHAMDCQ
jgi:hypothetical protein